MKLSPHPFSLRQLQYAVAVADTLSFGRAADACHVSQPSLSAQVALLEEVLGVRLFERDRRRVLLTAAGRQLVERARTVLREAADLADLALRAGDPLAGTLRIGVIPTVSPYLLPPLRTPLRNAHPQLTVMWLEDKTDVLLRKLDAGALDAAILALEADVGDVEREVLATDPFVLATPAAHPLGAKSAPAKPAELRDESVLLLDDGHCFREQALAFCSSARPTSWSSARRASPRWRRWWRTVPASRCCRAWPCRRRPRARRSACGRSSSRVPSVRWRWCGGSDPRWNRRSERSPRRCGRRTRTAHGPGPARERLADAPSSPFQVLRPADFPPLPYGRVRISSRWPSGSGK